LQSEFSWSQSRFTLDSWPCPTRACTWRRSAALRDAGEAQGVRLKWMKNNIMQMLFLNIKNFTQKQSYWNNILQLHAGYRSLNNKSVQYN